jgi:hypothetical protein
VASRATKGTVWSSDRVSGVGTPEDFAVFIDCEQARWEEVVDCDNIRIESAEGNGGRTQPNRGACFAGIRMAVRRARHKRTKEAAARFVASATWKALGRPELSMLTAVRK